MLRQGAVESLPVVEFDSRRLAGSGGQCKLVESLAFRGMAGVDGPAVHDEQVCFSGVLLRFISNPHDWTASLIPLIRQGKTCILENIPSLIPHESFAS